MLDVEQAKRFIAAMSGHKYDALFALAISTGVVRGRVLWLDGAGLVSSKDMRAFFDIAKRNGNRVILSGDYTQHSSAEAGAVFRLLEKEAGGETDSPYGGPSADGARI